MRTTLYASFLLVLAALLLSACSRMKQTRERISFNDNWAFQINETIDASAADFDDTGWRTLHLPHDFSIEGTFSIDNPATPGGGALPGGTGWYRKHFTVSEADRDKLFFIDFDGVYMNSSVWLNDQLLGTRPNGYISFRYDLTPYLRYGNDENVLVVKADNSQQPNSRWYSGSGIYRNVWLVKVNPIHVDQWGTYITTPQVTEEESTIQVETTLRNSTTTTTTVRLVTTLLDPNNQEAAQEEVQAEVASGTQSIVKQSFQLTYPALWSIDSPSLYKAVSRVYVNGKETDCYETTFGIRSFRFEVETGFYLNNKPLKILGVCNHHDLGCLGTAVNTRALERQIDILKAMGCNAIRTSHNPPAPELLELCDRMGMLVQDETFDMWRKRKSPYDYAQYFNEWHEIDLTDQVLRDRNHASVFMWSVGNEVLEQWTHAGADTLDLQEANILLNFGHTIDQRALEEGSYSVNSLIAIKLADIVKKLDTTRVITSGNNETSPFNHLFRSNAMDVHGFNYHHQNYEPFTQNFPGQKLISSESTSALMTRGYYMMPSDSMYIWPVSWDKRFEQPINFCSSYDNCHVPWGSTHEETWREVKRLPHVSGLFIWTGFDYLGEPTPFWWPSRSSYFGIIDLAGFPKDVYYMYQSEWTDTDVLHIFPHWNWTEGQEVDIWAYYNNADEVELFLNEQSLGTKRKMNDELHVSWRVPFSPGTLRAVSRKEGHKVLSKEIHTAGAPAQIVLTADRNTISADGKDLSFITVEIMDKDGNLVPDAENLVRFTIEGVGFIAGVDNGSQISHESFKASERKAFFGKALAVLQNNGKHGAIHLTASADGLKSATLTVKAL